jgi:hypothetical protein
MTGSKVNIAYVPSWQTHLNSYHSCSHRKAGTAQCNEMAPGTGEEYVWAGAIAFCKEAHPILIMPAFSFFPMTHFPCTI